LRFSTHVDTQGYLLNIFASSPSSPWLVIRPQQQQAAPLTFNSLLTLTLCDINHI
jgi:hypothetical protein